MINGIIDEKTSELSDLVSLCLRRIKNIYIIESQHYLTSVTIYCYHLFIYLFVSTGTIFFNYLKCEEDRIRLARR